MSDIPLPYPSQCCEVLGSQLHYIEAGEGDPILFLHGNPTSAYLWRNIMPKLAGKGRVIAVDLIGMGQSDKPDIDYKFVDHAAYLDGFIDTLGLKNITLVIHDWGSALGFHYAARHPGNVKGIAFMEAIVDTFKMSDMPLPFQAIFRLFRTPVIGKVMIQRLNFFVNKLLPMSIVRKLTKQEMQAYRAPYPTVASRKPLYQWPNEIPFDGKPEEVDSIVKHYRYQLATAEIPKLLLWAKPGALITPEVREALERDWQNLTSVYIGRGIHYVQEDCPAEISQAIIDWMDTTVTNA